MPVAETRPGCAESRRSATAPARWLGDVESIMATKQLRAPSSSAASTTATAPWLWPWADVQRAQWKAWLVWQHSMLLFQKDLWEQWSCRFAGGVPIDV